MENETEIFLDTIIQNTDTKFKKIAVDLKNNFLRSETLTEKQAEWIKNALVRNKKLRNLQIPEEISYEMSIALNEGEHEDEENNSEAIKQIITEEIETALYRILKRIS